ncbi:unnamed protein product [Chrysoparadoxa australica]
MPQDIAEAKAGGRDGQPTNGDTNTKARLSNILDSFQAFDTDMKIGTRQRREKDEHRIAQLTEELSGLEKTLNVEIKRRIELNKSIQTWADTEITQTTTRFKDLITERSDAIQERLNTIVGKLDSLEVLFSTEMAKIPVDIQRRTEELTKMLTDFECKFDAERNSRLEREGRIVKQLGDHEEVVSGNFDKERTARENTYAELRRTLDENIRSRMKGDEKFQSFVAEELAALRNAVGLERQTREKEDDEIVDALNRYTTKLQTSLKIINSAET